MFTLYPFAASIYYSLTDYSVLNAPEFVGVGNYVTLFSKDPLFWKSLYNTLYYAVISLPLQILVALGLATLLNQRVRGLAVFRTIFYLPSIVPIVGASIVWMWLLNPQYGIINGILYALGINGPGWITDPVWSKPSLIIMSLWGVGGSMIIYLAALQDVPVQLYEASELDGASPLHKFRHVTLPMISPAIFFQLVMGLIGALQYFTQAYVMTQGGPADSTLFYSLYLYNNAFRYFKMGYASAMAWILFIIILVLTLLVFRTSRSWVYYAGGR
ncbi:MAG: sugar ABC transporter permease [Firmicutes bacterium]|nr:sugar ABC transporter permease [Bacillota bacterium]